MLESGQPGPDPGFSLQRLLHELHLSALCLSFSMKFTYSVILRQRGDHTFNVEDCVVHRKHSLSAG